MPVITKDFHLLMIALFILVKKFVFVNSSCIFFPLFQEEQLSVSGERMFTILVIGLED